MLSGVVCPREAKSLPICEPVSYEQLGESVITIFFLERKGKKMFFSVDMCEMSVVYCSDFFSLPVPFISKLHREVVDYICLICHSASTSCSDNAEHV